MATRRDFLTRFAVGSAALTMPAWLPKGMPAVASGQVPDQLVRFSPEIEHVVRLIEDTPRDQLFEAIGTRITTGKLSYQEVVAALMLAGIRNVQPRPQVGFKFHSVLVVNSAHLASINSPAAERWLPIFWGLDYFKRAQADDRDQGDWAMSTVNSVNLPRPEEAQREFHQAMLDWQPAPADAAISVLARQLPANKLFELMTEYGCRDFRDIGHKAIYVANAFRTLECIGWQHAEPILRSLTYALQCRGGDPNPATNDLLPDRPQRFNQELLTKVRTGWAIGKVDDQATRELVEMFRQSSYQEAAQAVFDALQAGVSPLSIYDAMYVGSAEMLMRQPGIISLHAVTTTNALGFAFRRVGDSQLRLKILLQNAAFLAMFMDRVRRNPLADRTWDNFEAVGNFANSEQPLQANLEAIVANIGPNHELAANQTLGLLESDPAAVSELFHQFRRMVFLKGTNPHDYKYSSAVLEDYFQISPPWRNRFAAMITYHLRGAHEPDTGLLERTRLALA